jgi:hypothetical protein
MNIFFLSTNPVEAAVALVDKHITKMPLESAQMLSTAHRLLDGIPAQEGKKTIYLLPGEDPSNLQVYRVAHAKHPSTIWTMTSKANYEWHWALQEAMLAEYTRRYGKVHGAARLSPILMHPPKNIPDIGPTPPIPAMPDKYKRPDAVDSYQRYYAGSKWRFAKWKDAPLPEWMIPRMAEVWNDDELLERVGLTQDALVAKTPRMDKRILAAARELSIEYLPLA